MRLWTLHPRYLDARGLVAAWREALLAQAVLAGRTRGYRHHPQLERFRARRNPEAALAAFLRGIAAEARRRGYHFDVTRIGSRTMRGRMPETRGQLLHEWRHLRAKLAVRAPALVTFLGRGELPDPHPLFRIVPGPVRRWEKAPRASGRTGARRAARGRRR